MALRDGVDVGVLGLLVGHKGDAEKSARKQLAGTILGVALGAQIDLGHSNEQILEACRGLLATIRCALDAGFADRLTALTTEIVNKQGS